MASANVTRGTRKSHSNVRDNSSLGFQRLIRRKGDNRDKGPALSTGFITSFKSLKRHAELQLNKLISYAHAPWKFRLKAYQLSTLLKPKHFESIYHLYKFPCWSKTFPHSIPLKEVIFSRPKCQVTLSPSAKSFDSEFQMQTHQPAK